MTHERKNLQYPTSACPLTVVAVTVILSVFCALVVGSAFAQGGASSGPASSAVTPSDPDAAKPAPGLSSDERIVAIEQRLMKVQDNVDKAELRSLQNKIMAIELIRWVKWIVAVLLVIAISFPFTLWFLSKKRLIGLSGLSDEVSSTLVLVEERQAKLAVILKEVQSELDYVHNMSVPDLKNLIDQAEKYIQQNEKDLDRTRAQPTGPQRAAAPRTGTH